MSFSFCVYCYIRRDMAIPTTNLWDFKCDCSVDQNSGSMKAKWVLLGEIKIMYVYTGE